MTGVGFLGLLTICLVVLKLTGLITISWWWVFSPILAALILWVLITISVAIVTYMAGKRY